MHQEFITFHLAYIQFEFTDERTQLINTR